MSFVVQDYYFHKAKKDRFLARAAYKLEEIQKRHGLIRTADRVLDLGAAPGSWIQVVVGLIGPKGLVVGVDIKTISHAFPHNVVILNRDVFDPGLVEELQRGFAPFDVVLSDMAPATSGIRCADSARSALLFEQAMTLAVETLKPGGNFLAKIFQGSEFHSLLQEAKKVFGRVKVIKPAASRKESKEVYVLAMNYRKLL